MTAPRLSCDYPGGCMVYSSPLHPVALDCAIDAQCDISGVIPDIGEHLEYQRADDGRWQAVYRRRYAER